MILASIQTCPRGNLDGSPGGSFWWLFVPDAVFGLETGEFFQEGPADQEEGDCYGDTVGEVDKKAGGKAGNGCGEG